MLDSTTTIIADLEQRILRITRQRDDDLAAKIADLTARIAVLEERVTAAETRMQKPQKTWWRTLLQK